MMLRRRPVRCVSLRPMAGVISLCAIMAVISCRHSSGDSTLTPTQDGITDTLPVQAPATLDLVEGDRDSVNGAAELRRPRT